MKPQAAGPDFVERTRLESVGRWKAMIDQPELDATLGSQAAKPNFAIRLAGIGVADYIGARLVDGQHDELHLVLLESRQRRHLADHPSDGLQQARIARETNLQVQPVLGRWFAQDSAIIAG